MTAAVVTLALLLQASQTAPVLSFPEAGLDDPSAYQGYQTRFYRDSKRNAVQIYLEPKAGRIVLVWADAANESGGSRSGTRRGRRCGPLGRGQRGGGRFGTCSQPGVRTEGRGPTNRAGLVRAGLDAASSATSSTPGGTCCRSALRRSG